MYKALLGIIIEFWFVTSQAQLVPKPTTQASNLMITQPFASTLQLTWTNGNGTSRLVVGRDGGSVNQAPVDGVTYAASSSFSLGASLSGNYVVYNGSGNSVTVTDIQPATIYGFFVFEYNGTIGLENYLVSNALGNPASSDITPPVVSAPNSPTTIAPNTPIQASAIFTDNESGIFSAKIQYRPIAGAASSNFTSLDMTLSAGSMYVATIPSSADVTELGVEFKYLVTNGAGLDNSAYQMLYKTAIKHPFLPITSYPASAAGKEAINYRIIAIPLVLDFNTANNVFTGVLNDYDPTSWRMFKYNGAGFSELTGSSALMPGVGYWFIAANFSSPLNTGPGTTVNVSTNTPFTVTLNTGWNQIGNPYNFDISWADVIAANPSQAANLGENGSLIRVFRGGMDNRDVLKSFEGGFVKYLGPNGTAIKIPVAKNLPKQGGRQVSIEKSKIENSLDQPFWEILFNLKDADVEYKLGGFGMHPEAKEGFDFHDDFNSPRFIEYLEVKFPKKYVGMTYTKDVVQTSENYVWGFTVESNLKEENASLGWDNSYFGKAKEIYLLDVVLHKVTNMSLQGHYEFNRAVSKDFKVVFGNDEFVKEELLPNEIFLYDPFPNPFSDEVTIGYALPKDVNANSAEIEVYNSVGSRVSQMQTSQPGVGNWVWKSDQQSSGLYFVRIRAGNQSITKKILKR